MQTHNNNHHTHPEIRTGIRVKHIEVLRQAQLQPQQQQHYRPPQHTAPNSNQHSVKTLESLPAKSEFSQDSSSHHHCFNKDRKKIFEAQRVRTPSPLAHQRTTNNGVKRQQQQHRVSVNIDDFFTKITANPAQQQQQLLLKTKHPESGSMTNKTAVFQAASNFTLAAPPQSRAPSKTQLAPFHNVSRGQESSVHTLSIIDNRRLLSSNGSSSNNNVTNKDNNSNSNVQLNDKINQMQIQIEKLMRSLEQSSKNYAFAREQENNRARINAQQQNRIAESEREIQRLRKVNQEQENKIRVLEDKLNQALIDKAALHELTQKLAQNALSPAKATPAVTMEQLEKWNPETRTNHTYSQHSSQSKVSLGPPQVSYAAAPPPLSSMSHPGLGQYTAKPLVSYQNNNILSLTTGNPAAYPHVIERGAATSLHLRPNINAPANTLRQVQTNHPRVQAAPFPLHHQQQQPRSRSPKPHTQPSTKESYLSPLDVYASQISASNEPSPLKSPLLAVDESNLYRFDQNSYY